MGALSLFGMLLTVIGGERFAAYTLNVHSIDALAQTEFLSTVDAVVHGAAKIEAYLHHPHPVPAIQRCQLED